MTYADSDALGKEVWSAYAAIGRSAHDNLPVVRQIPSTPHLPSSLTENFANHVAERRYASGQAALDFGDQIFQKVRGWKGSEQLAATKLQKKVCRPTITLEPWEVSYWAEKQRGQLPPSREAFRPYFPIDRVISGMYEIAQQPDYVSKNDMSRLKLHGGRQKAAGLAKRSTAISSTLKPRSISAPFTPIGTARVEAVALDELQ